MQLALLDGGGAPRLLPRRLAAIARTRLSPSAWIDHVATWVEGSQALMDELVRRVSWEVHRRRMYERWVMVPRLTGTLDAEALPAAVSQMRDILSRRYAADLGEVSFALYRDGDDSVAWHRDKGLRDRADSISAIVSLGGPRTFCVRRFRDGGGVKGQGGGPTTRPHSVSFSVGWGDLLVMGGACQQDWEHAVPKVRHGEPRVAVMFRPTARLR